jgi:hypothetical protein
LNVDARQYAADYGVTVEEAARRSGLQGDVGELDAKLEANEAATFGGLELLHEPTFEVAAYFTEGGEQTILPYVQGTPLEGMVRAKQVSATHAELEAAQAEAINVAEANGFVVEADINVTTNRAELYVTDEDRLRFDVAMLTANPGLPANVDVVTVDALSEPMDFYGGTHLTTCTTGFVVRRDNGSEGMVTAGHCDNFQNWRGGKTVHVDQAVHDSYDVQYHYTPNVDDRARFYSGVGLRPVRYVRGRDHQFKGRIICKYGKTLGFKCAKIVGKTYTIQSFGTSMNATFMRARRTGGGLVAGGDSGGPVFDGTPLWGRSVPARLMAT